MSGSCDCSGYPCEHVTSINMFCSTCLAVWDQPLTEKLTAPKCPRCGEIGDREVSVEYPVGVLAGSQFPRPSMVEIGTEGLRAPRAWKLPWLWWLQNRLRGWWFCERHGLDHSWIWDDPAKPYCEVCGIPGELFDV